MAVRNRGERGRKKREGGKREREREGKRAGYWTVTDAKHA